MKALDLARALIHRPSIAPADEGALDVLEAAVDALGFHCRRQTFEAPDYPPIDNLYARLGRGGRNFCFAGHTDVVPPGDTAAWSVDPFGAEVVNGRLFGRGAADMKGAIACFVEATSHFLARHPDFDETISLLITGDEEKDCVNGTVKLLGWCAGQGEHFDACLVGEPTNPRQMGEEMKIGRRGSISGWLTVYGAQGHVAYPHLTDNPITRLTRILTDLDDRVLDHGTPHFPPSNFEVTTVDVGNPAINVVPAKAQAAFNIRFNDLHSGAGLERWLHEVCQTHADGYDLKTKISGEAFLCPPGQLATLITNACEAVLGTRPAASTSGGISDARFIHHYCEVAEFGLVGQSMHKVDENVRLNDLEALVEVYVHILEGYFYPETPE